MPSPLAGLVPDGEETSLILQASHVHASHAGRQQCVLCCLAAITAAPAAGSAALSAAVLCPSLLLPSLVLLLAGLLLRLLQRCLLGTVGCLGIQLELRQRCGPALGIIDQGATCGQQESAGGSHAYGCTV